MLSNARYGVLKFDIKNTLQIIVFLSISMIQNNNCKNVQNEK